MLGAKRGFCDDKPRNRSLGSKAEHLGKFLQQEDPCKETIQRKPLQKNSGNHCRKTGLNTTVEERPFRAA
jgi:hypothetical protein